MLPNDNAPEKLFSLKERCNDKNISSKLTFFQEVSASSEHLRSVYKIQSYTFEVGAYGGFI